MDVVKTIRQNLWMTAISVEDEQALVRGTLRVCGPAIGEHRELCAVRRPHEVADPGAGLGCRLNIQEIDECMIVQTDGRDHSNHAVGQIGDGVSVGGPCCGRSIRECAGFGPSIPTTEVDRKSEYASCVPSGDQEID